jgi:hypothetical protein
MKRFGFVLVIVCLTAGTAFAQNWGNPQQITVNGSLQLQNGSIAVVSGNITYFVPVLTQYFGFIEGLKEGVQVSIDGFASGNTIRPSKVTLNGKSYDFPVNPQVSYNYSNCPFGYSCCGLGHHGNGGNRRGGYGHHSGRW